MAYLNDTILDAALALLVSDGDRLDVCSTEPTTYTEATSTYTLGNKTAISIGSPANRTPNGRKVTIAAITTGSVTATGTATHWAITDTAGGGVLLATGALASSQALTSGNTLTVAAFDIGVPDAV